MTKRKLDSTDEQTDKSTDGQTDIQADNSTEVQADAPAPIDPQLARDLYELGKKQEPQRRRRPQAPPPAPLELDPDFVKYPERMQYALLLALLLRMKGSARFSHADMDHKDTDYNIVFARTRDGRGLEVTVVSSESGIIRSPEREREAARWRQNSDEQTARTLTYQPLPPPPSTESTPQHPAEALFRLHGMEAPGGAMTGIFPQIPPGANPGGGVAIPQLPQEQQPQAPVIQMPARDPNQPQDGSASYRFPFQVGSSPQTATGPATVNLGLVEAQLLARDRELEAQEAEAIARQERGEQ